MAEKVYKLQKQLEEKREARKRTREISESLETSSSRITEEQKTGNSSLITKGKPNNTWDGNAPSNNTNYNACQNISEADAKLPKLQIRKEEFPSPPESKVIRTVKLKW